MKTLHAAWKGRDKIVIGMLHLPALPGAPGSNKSVAEIRDYTLRDAEVLVEGGVDGLIMENFGDAPFFPGRVPAAVIACMSALACDIHRLTKMPLGINVLRNDGLSALAVAIASGADFIRVNVLSGARITDQGIIAGIAHDLLRERAMLGAGNIRIWADADVKHSAALVVRPLEEEVDELINRALADAVIISGTGTGKPADPEQARQIKQIAGDTPLFIGSGMHSKNLHEFREYADGFIVGTAFKVGGIPSNPVELPRVKEFINALRG